MRRNYYTMAILAFVLILSTMAFVGCSDEEAITGVEDESSMVSGVISVTPVGPMVGIRPQIVPCDAAATAYWSNIPTTSTHCGPVLPNATCAGGVRGFTSFITVRNNGPAPIPANTINIWWWDSVSGWGFAPMVPPHAAIPAGGSMNFQRPYYMGPCDGPLTVNIRSFQARVVVTGRVPDRNLANNLSPIYQICN